MIKLDKDTYDLLMLAANWFAAVGTVGAVMVALYLSRRDYRHRVSITATDMHLFCEGKNEIDDNNLYVIISATNNGRRPITLAYITWSIGFFKKNFAIQIHDYRNSISSKLPTALADGEEARYPIPINAFKENNLNFISPYLKWWPSLMILSLRVGFKSSLGRFHWGKPSKSLKKLILNNVAKP
jgi:hypothetical protein